MSVARARTVTIEPSDDAPTADSAMPTGSAVAPPRRNRLAGAEADVPPFGRSLAGILVGLGDDRDRAPFVDRAHRVRLLGFLAGARGEGKEHEARGGQARHGGLAEYRSSSPVATKC